MQTRRIHRHLLIRYRFHSRPKPFVRFFEHAHVGPHFGVYERGVVPDVDFAPSHRFDGCRTASVHACRPEKRAKRLYGRRWPMKRSVNSGLEIVPDKMRTSVYRRRPGKCPAESEFREVQILPFENDALHARTGQIRNVTCRLNYSVSVA